MAPRKLSIPWSTKSQLTPTKHAHVHVIRLVVTTFIVALWSEFCEDRKLMIHASCTVHFYYQMASLSVTVHEKTMHNSLEANLRYRQIKFWLPKVIMSDFHIWINTYQTIVMNS